jgi:hypothetical protein
VKAGECGAHPGFHPGYKEFVARVQPGVGLQDSQPGCNPGMGLREWSIPDRHSACDHVLTTRPDPGGATH